MCLCRLRWLLRALEQKKKKDGIVRDRSTLVHRRFSRICRRIQRRCFQQLVPGYLSFSRPTLLIIYIDWEGCVRFGSELE